MFRVIPVCIRSVSSLCRKPVPFIAKSCRAAPLAATSRLSGATPLSIHRQFYSENAEDKSLVAFLQDEIQQERSTHVGSLPTITGFDVTASGPTVKLVKKIGKETLTVEFNVSDADEEGEEEVEMGDEGEAAAEEVDSPWKPSFQPPMSVRLTKDGSDSALAFNCQILPSNEDEEGTGGAEEEGDELFNALFHIMDMAVLEGKDSEWNNSKYSVSSSSMDVNLYDILVTMLTDRGMDKKFVKEVTSFCTDYEHGLYIKFLESLEDYVKS